MGVGYRHRTQRWLDDCMVITAMAGYSLYAIGL